MVNKNRFEGWYFKHQLGDDTICFIPGVAGSGAFVQVITGTGSEQYEVSNLSVDGDVIKAGNCRFSLQGCFIDLPGISGQISYHNITALKSDIMGPFRYLPLQCRHGVISMEHSLEGSIVIGGNKHDYSGGKGYIEKDSGTSFPRSYLWLQCNDFSESCSVMLSIAHIPFGLLGFRGCICAIIYNGKEYRLATYKGVRIKVEEKDFICISQGDLRLEIKIQPSNNGFPLRSPVKGNMTGIIHESNNAIINLKLWEKGKKIIDLNSSHAMYEYVPEKT